MPELPEVEYGRKLADTICTGKRIIEITCEDDAIVFEKRTPQQWQRALLHRSVTDVCRRGKYLWFALDQRPWPLFHFGMTGAFHTPSQPTIQLEAGPAISRAEWPPRFTKWCITMEDGMQLAMTNARRLGRARLTDDPHKDSAIARLGFDPLTHMPPLPEFAALLSHRRGALKGLLLNQSFAAGVGNWIADEVLYQARLDPRRIAQKLSPEEVKRLHHTLGSVIQHAVSVDADKSRFPTHWLFHHRWGKTDATTSEGDPVEFLTVAGRTTAWVPSVQH